MDRLRTIGRYRLDAHLASGAMGDVYRGHDPIIDRPVAIKILRRELLQGGDPDGWLQRFRREAQAAGRHFHPNIVTIFDFGEEEGTPFLAMEYIDGESLDKLLKRMGRLPPEFCISLIMQVLSALAFAHDNGIVHRDIKPGNIMVLANGHVKVADFGISRVAASDLTIVGDVLGTPAYMAPEQHLGAPGDHRADLFAAGVTLFEMLSGVKPFRGRSITEMISHMETRGPEDITAHSPEAPPALKRVIEMALAFDPEHRFPNAAEFANNLAQISEVRTSIVAPPVRDDETVIAPPLRAAAARQPPLASGVLAEIEHELTMLIGPLARIVAQRAAKTCANLDRLYQDLAIYIADETDRAAFLSRGQERIRKEATTTGAAVTGQPMQTSTGRTQPIAIAPDVLTRIEANLAQYIGPIARVVVRRQLSKSASLRDLYRDLASLIPDERDRTQFLKSQPSG